MAGGRPPGSRAHVIAGDSAGAGLAVGVALHERDHRNVEFSAQLLVSPCSAAICTVCRQRSSVPRSSILPPVHDGLTRRSLL
ncbi:alpha/beta hydrolase [Streptomyces sp. SID6648]|nr:alpha/beta hydrolase [Streptomyces sp. SID6648]